MQNCIELLGKFLLSPVVHLVPETECALQNSETVSFVVQLSNDEQDQLCKHHQQVQLAWDHHTSN